MPCRAARPQGDVQMQDAREQVGVPADVGREDDVRGGFPALDPPRALSVRRREVVDCGSGLGHRRELYRDCGTDFVVFFSRRNLRQIASTDVPNTTAMKRKMTTLAITTNPALTIKAQNAAARR